MPELSGYIKGIRDKIGNDLLMCAAAGTFIFDEQGRVLLLRHYEGVWTNPGGMIEPFESAADAAVRETYEEIGVVVELTGLIGVFGGPDHHITYKSGDQMAYIAVIFEARITEGTPEPDGDEAHEIAWFTHEETRELNMTPQKRRHLDVAFARNPAGHFEPPTWTPK